MPIGRLASHIMDFCYPGVCAHCQAGIDGSGFVCDECSGTLDELAEAPACERCAMPLSRGGAPCPWCRGKGLSPLDRIVRLGVFKPPLKELIHQMKYHRRWAIGEHLADRLAATDRARDLIGEQTILVPVPLHFTRQIARGYNQAEIIARRLAHKLQCDLARPARRTRNTVTQTHIHSQVERQANVRGAFALKRGSRIIAGRPVVVVDDVMTTGATLRSLARTLRQAGPSSLAAIVLAIADPRGRDFQAI